jgi:hypothetical protein
LSLLSVGLGDSTSPRPICAAFASADYASAFLCGLEHLEREAFLAPLLDNLSLSNRPAFRHQPQPLDRSRGLGKFDKRRFTRRRNLWRCQPRWRVEFVDLALIGADPEYVRMHRKFLLRCD